MVPRNAERIIDLLQYLAELGVMPAQRCYDRAASEEGLAQSRLLKKVFGNWDEVARWCGLVPLSQWQHVRVTTAQLVLMDLARDLHGGQCGPTPSEYEWYSPDGVPSVAFLRMQFGGQWRDVLAHFGLAPSPMNSQSMLSDAETVERWRQRDRLAQAEKMLAMEERPLEGLSSRTVCYRRRDGKWVRAVATRLR